MTPLQLDSADDLESLALELGGSVTHKNGRVFNASGRSGAAKLPARSTTVAPPEPVAPPVDRNAELMAKVVELLARPAPAPPEPLPMPAPSVVVQAAPRTSWEFAFRRNPDGTIASITATPKE